MKFSQAFSFSVVLSSAENTTEKRFCQQEKIYYFQRLKLHSISLISQYRSKNTFENYGEVETLDRVENCFQMEVSILFRIYFFLDLSVSCILEQMFQYK